MSDFQDAYQRTRKFAGQLPGCHMHDNDTVRLEEGLDEMAAAHAEVEAERDHNLRALEMLKSMKHSITHIVLAAVECPLTAAGWQGCPIYHEDGPLPCPEDRDTTLRCWVEFALAATADGADKETDTGDTNTDDERGEQDERPATDRRADCQRGGHKPPRSMDTRQAGQD